MAKSALVVTDIHKTITVMVENMSDEARTKALDHLTQVLLKDLSHLQAEELLEDIIENCHEDHIEMLSEYLENRGIDTEADRGLMLFEVNDLEVKVQKETLKEALELTWGEMVRGGGLHMVYLDYLFEFMDPDQLKAALFEITQFYILDRAS